MSERINVIKRAREAGVVVPAFNVPYLPMIEPIVRAVADQKSFAQIATAQIDWQTMESKNAREVMAEFRKWDQPDHVRLHLDHIPSIDEITGEPNDYYAIISEAIEIGYPSVMIDGSREDTIDENIAVTRRIVDLGHSKGVFVEAEVGMVFGYAVEDMPPYETIFAERIGFTTEQQVRRMVAETGCDWLSVAVGNIHGAVVGARRFEQKAEARLDAEHIATLSAAAGVPLVLHGGSSVRADDLRPAFANGIAKINVGKELRMFYQIAMRETNSVPTAQQAVYDRATELIKEHYGICNTSGIFRKADEDK